MSKNKKYSKYTLAEKEKILTEFINRKGSAQEIVLKYNLDSRQTLYRWKNLKEKHGHITDNRGGNIISYKSKVENNDFENMSKEELIEYIRIEKLIKKQIELNRAQKKNTK